MLARSIGRAPLTLTLSALSMFALAFGPGCSPTVRTFEQTGGSGGQGGAGGDVSSSSGDVGGMGGMGGVGGMGGSPPAACMPGMPPYAGPLCGPADKPCKLLVDEIVVDTPSFRNDAPAIAIDGACTPSIASSVAVQGFHGFYSTRTGDGMWDTGPETPFPLATAALAKTQDGRVLVLANGGNSTLTLFTQVQGQWDSGVPMPGSKGSMTAAGAALDSAGALHAVTADTSALLLYGVYDKQGWQVAQPGAKITARMPLALSPEGKPHIAYWSSGMNGWNLNWVSPPGMPEIAAPLGSSSLGSEPQRHAIAVTAADSQNPTGRPHILFARPIPGQTSTIELVYATRQGAGAWNVFSIAQENSTTAKFCNTPPTQAGQTCNFDYDELWPLAVIASGGGDVRFLYLHNLRKGTSAANCMDPTFCYWEIQTNNSTGELVVGWLDGSQKAGSAVVADKIMAQWATATLDPLGRVHVAGYDSYPPGSNGTTVRYLRFGP